MRDYEVGAQLRRQLLSSPQLGQAGDARRLQGLVSDVCADGQAPLLPALKYLVLTPQFSQALQQTPPLPLDPQLLLQFRQQLEEVFAAAICSRMDAVLRGLLELPELVAGGPAAGPGMVPAAVPAPLGEMVQASPPPQANRGVVVLLSFIAGVLVVGLLGGLVWVMQLTRQQRDTPTPAPLPAAGSGINAPAAATPPPAPDLNTLDRDRAIAAVQEIYAELAGGNGQAARQRISNEAADQFDPTFLSQFEQFSVANLVETGREGTLVHLSGVVTFVYPDGSRQSESRSFSVDVGSDPALITASRFEAVISPRQ